jgi:outer membrane protein OmpA-like peptidoglycan-associated protein
VTVGRPLEEVQDAILDRFLAGETVDRESVVSENPEHAVDLRRFFDVLQAVEGPAGVVTPEFASLGEFRILRTIGRGGMGIVYEAEQPSLRRRIALKVLPPALARDPRFTARFRREAEAAGRLRHPNIIPVYSVGEVGGTPFFAMEMVDGLSLAAVIRARAAGKPEGEAPGGRPWRAWVVEVASKVADALECAHREGILHRDVKPSNVLLEPDGTPRLTDFGLAMDLEAAGLTQPGESPGTLPYMSPEQAARREQPLDGRTDVYSLGVTLYEALTLRLPYAGATLPDVIVALHRGDVVPPRRLDPGMPPELEEVLLRALRREPKERYATAAEFAEDLRRIAPVLTGERAPGTLVASRGRSRRRWILAGTGVALAVFAWFATREDTALHRTLFGPSRSTELVYVTPRAEPATTRVLVAGTVRPAPRVPGELVSSADFEFQFRANSDALDDAKPENARHLGALADPLKTHPDARLLLRGHVSGEKADEFAQGGDATLKRAAASAMEFSRKRAEAVKEALVRTRGIDGSRIEVEGRGWEEPLGGDPERDRRIEGILYVPTEGK